MAFDYASGWLQPFLLFEISENTIRKATRGYGELQLEREAEWMQASQDPAELQTRLRTEQARPPRVYGSIDGAHVRIAERRLVEKTAEKWREMKVGCWYRVAPVPKSHYKKRHRKKDALGHQALRAEGMHYFCEIAEVDEFEPLFWATGCQAKADLAAEVVFVCDGAWWKPIIPKPYRSWIGSMPKNVWKRSRKRSAPANKPKPGWTIPAPLCGRAIRISSSAPVKNSLHNPRLPPKP
jgi:hypothetical protein